MVSFPLTKGHGLHRHHSHSHHYLHKKHSHSIKEDTAVQKVFKIPDFVEKILFLAYSREKNHAACLKLHSLRLVSKVWQSVIDGSAILQSLAYSAPKIHSGGDQFGVCHDHLDEIANTMKMVHHLQGDARRATGIKELNRCAHLFAHRAHASNIPVTKPAMNRLYILFEGTACQDWMRDLKVFTDDRTHDINRSDDSTIAYYYHLSNSSGINVDEVINSVVSILRVFYSFEENFMIEKIILSYYNSSWEPDHTLPSYYRDDFEIISYLWSPYGVPIGRRGLRVKANDVLRLLPFIPQQRGTKPAMNPKRSRTQVMNLPRIDVSA
ncbi:hypothetical protein AA313_de0202452 [Arthrobotrys entomopaga]|nr:hypothetical protein AA313_de0202452 [Arthrobotrys entomopaga]